MIDADSVKTEWTENRTLHIDEVKCALMCNVLGERENQIKKVTAQCVSLKGELAAEITSDGRIAQMSDKDPTLESSDAK